MSAVEQGHKLHRVVTITRKVTAMTAVEQRHKLHRIVIVGGGVGGLVTATHLVRRLGRSDKAEVLLVDRNRAHVWKPMLHTFAAGTSDYAYENVSFIPHAKLTGYKYWPGDFGGLDRKAQTIKLKPTALPAAGEMLPATTIHYDTLVRTLGSQANDFGTPGVLEHCHFIDDIKQATVFNDLLRSKVVLAANAGKDLDVVIVGGGATGVELAAELTERMEIVSRYDSDVTRTHLRLSLIETANRVLGSFPEKISHSVETKLRASVSMYAPVRKSWVWTRRAYPHRERHLIRSFQISRHGEPRVLGGICGLRYSGILWVLKGRRLQGLAGPYGAFGALPYAPA